MWRPALLKVLEHTRWYSLLSEAGFRLVDVSRGTELIEDFEGSPHLVELFKRGGE